MTDYWNMTMGDVHDEAYSNGKGDGEAIGYKKGYTDAYKEIIKHLENNISEKRFVVDKRVSHSYAIEKLKQHNPLDTDSDRYIKDLAIHALQREELESNDIGMFCPNCQRGVPKHLYGDENNAFEVKFCPWCGAQLNWEMRGEK